ncbi:MAG: PAS domain-containing hybrid sensor histidine kinase/response regulator [Cyanobacteria bacterium J083]|nr:MAG: PAS domain-containing hybrid sensor histidine kinase/response regulator [Cyanobacteria bacterium J083]
MAIVTRCKLTAPKKQTMASSANAIALGITRFWTETILVDSEAKFRTLINNIPGAFYRCAYDSSWTMEFLSEAIFDICGYKAECFIHNQSISFVDLMPLEDQDRVRKAVDLALAQKKPYILEYRLIHADGSIRWAYEKGQGIFDSQGKLLWLDGVIFDITEKKQAEAELKQAKEAAEAANRAKSTFLANMSHELRTPLNAILGFAQLMERDITTNPQQKESLEIINRSGEHLLNLINDVLEMSKIEAGRTIINSQPFDLHYFLHNLQQMFLVKASAKRLSLQFNLSEDLPTCIKTDENKLKQILINLLSNAVKFTEKGSVKLTAKLLPSETIVNSEDLITLSFQIEDTGKGIAAKEIESLFEPFVQTSSGIKSQGGTGLGLAISRQFVELLGGTISVQSIVGKGSIFSFTIKAAATLASEIELRPPSKKVLKLAPHQPTYRILVVDDTLDSRNLLAKLLNTVGFATRTASNGQEAITIWQTWQPDLIWMDMRMPVMDGYSATKAIKNSQLGQNTVIIALTASAFEEEQNSMLEVGCDDLVKKPFKEEIIFEKIAHYLPVEYIYQDQNPKITPPQLPKLTQADLAGINPSWLQSLYLAAIAVDSDLILALIDTLPTSHQHLKSQLIQLVDNYDFDTLIKLTEAYQPST